MWSARRRSLQLPALIALFVACFHFLIYHPFFKLTSFSPMCGRPCVYSMRSRVYETVRCPSVRLSVYPSMGPQQQTRCCRFAAVGPAAGDVDRLLQQRRAAGECGQCHVYRKRRKLNTDFFTMKLIQQQISKFNYRQLTLVKIR